MELRPGITWVNNRILREWNEELELINNKILREWN